MDPIKQSVHSPGARDALRARCDHAGAVICPNCEVIIVTPCGHVLRAGIGRCPRCDHAFRLTAPAAKKGNAASNGTGCSVFEQAFRNALSGCSVYARN